MSWSYGAITKQYTIVGIQCILLVYFYYSSLVILVILINEFQVVINRHAVASTVKETHCLVPVESSPEVAKKGCDNVILRKWGLVYLQCFSKVYKRPLLVDVGETPLDTFANARQFVITFLVVKITAQSTTRKG